MKCPPLVGVVMAASTGGLGALTEVFKDLPPTPCATFFVVQHGVAWMLTRRLKGKTTMKVGLAKDGIRAVPDFIYVAPGNRHLWIQPGSLTLRLTDNPPENFIYPSANVLFRSAAKAFGRHCLAVVMTGMGSDGSLGAAAVAAAGGVVIAQDPKTADAPSMPRAVINLGVANGVVPLADLGTTISRYVDTLYTPIEKQKSQETSATTN